MQFKKIEWSLLLNVLVNQLHKQCISVTDPRFHKGAPTPGRGASLIFGIIFGENCMKMKKMEWEGRHASSHPHNRQSIFYNWFIWFKVPIGGSRGGVRDARPPLGVQILSISCSFRENLACSRPPWRVHAPPGGFTPPPRENPGSATGTFQTFSSFSANIKCYSFSDLYKSDICWAAVTSGNISHFYTCSKRYLMFSERKWSVIHIDFFHHNWPKMACIQDTLRLDRFPRLSCRWTSSIQDFFWISLLLLLLLMSV